MVFSVTAIHRSGRRFSRQKRRGMTFLEIMIVIVILGILLAVTAPRMKGTGERAALTGATREIVAACNYARQAAISTQRDVWIKFDVNGDRWRIDLNVDPEEMKDDRRFNPEARSTSEAVRMLPPKIGFVEVNTETGAFEESEGEKYPLFIFHPNGTATSSYAVIENSRGSKMTIQVTPSTGRVEGYRGGPRSFSEKLKAMGVDPSAFATEDEAIAFVEGDNANPDDPNASRRDRERRDRDAYYESVLERIAGPRIRSSETRYGR